MISQLRAELTKMRAATEDLKEMSSISTPNARLESNIEAIDHAILEMDSILNASAETPQAAVATTLASTAEVSHDSAEEDEHY